MSTTGGVLLGVRDVRGAEGVWPWGEGREASERIEEAGVRGVAAAEMGEGRERRFPPSDSFAPKLFLVPVPVARAEEVVGAGAEAGVAAKEATDLAGVLMLWVGEMLRSC